MLLGYKMCMIHENSAKDVAELINEALTRPNGIIAIQVGLLVTLEIPEEAAMVKPYGFNKYRCSMAKVIEMNPVLLDIEKDWNFRIADESYPGYGYPMMRDCDTVYYTGEMVYADSFNADPDIECSNGIHFFDNIDDVFGFFREYCSRMDASDLWMLNLIEKIDALSGSRRHFVRLQDMPKRRPQ